MSIKPEYKVGDYVEISKKRKGVIRYQGVVGPFGLCFGIELDSPSEGGNNGTFDGEVFFECGDGQGTFVKGAKIIQKLAPPKPPSTNKTSSDKTDHKHTDDDDDEKDTKKRSKATKKKSIHKTKKSTGAKDSKAAERKNRRNMKSSTKRTKSKGAKGKKAAKKIDKKRNKSMNGLEEFLIPADIAATEKMQLIYPKLSTNSKLHMKKRVELLKICVDIISDESCDEAICKYAVDGYKKVFAEQMKDKKFLIHNELYNILEIMMVKYYKLHKSKNTYYLKHLMNHFSKLKPNDKKGVDALAKILKSMIKHIGLRDKKQLILILNEFLRQGTSSKLKTVKQQSWQLIYFSLELRQNEGKLSRDILEAIEKGLKQGLSNSDRLIQEGAFRILDLLAPHEPKRVEKLFNRMSATAQKLFAKKYPASAPLKKGKKGGNKSRLSVEPRHKAKKLSVGQYNFDADALAFINKRSSLERLEEVDTGKKRSGKKTKSKRGGAASKKNEAKKSGKKDKKNVKREDSGLRDKYNKIKKGTKTKNGKKKADKSTREKKKKKGDKSSKKGAKEKKGSKLKKKHQRSERNVMEPDSFGDLGELLSGDLSTLANALAADDDDEDAINISGEALDLPLLPESTTTQSIDSTNSLAEEEGIEIDDETEQVVIKMNDSNDAFPNFPLSFLEVDTRINWKTLEYLCSDNKTNVLMAILSRLEGDHMDLTQDKLEAIDYKRCIPNTLPLSSDDDKEIALTQLSYNLMRLLSIDGSGDDKANSNNGALSSYLLRKIDVILLHSLAVYHTQVSKGNVYHGRVLLEIILNSWPKPLMIQLTKAGNAGVLYENLQSLFKNALFRNLHQGNLNSFFLDLICYRDVSGDKTKPILTHKKKMIALFREWQFMPYLLRTSSSFEVGFDGDDEVATKYATFFIDLVARSAAIQEVAPLFEGLEHAIIDSFISGLLDEENKRSTWHRMFCGQILIQFMDICSRPTIMDPTQLLAAESGLIEPEQSPNILYPLFNKCLKRLHSFIPKLSALVMNYESDLGEIKLACATISKPFGQIRLHCLELLTISADFAQFQCGNVLGEIPTPFWNYLLEMAFIHQHNNIFLCHFRRLIHLTMIFRRRILKHLFVEKKLLDRFIAFYVSQKTHTALHGYILQMIYDIWQHDQDIDSDDDGTNEYDEEDTDSVKYTQQFI